MKVDMIKRYKQIFSTEDGKLVLEDLQKKFKKRAYTEDGNALSMAYRDGCRSVYEYIEDKVNKEIK
jgi:hypothetical protein